MELQQTETQVPPSETRSPSFAARSSGEGKVAPIKTKPRSEWLPWTAPVVLFCGTALLLVIYLGQFAALIRTQYKVVALKDKQRLLERERTDLQLQIQHLTSLERVENVAVGQLKMTVPSHRMVLQTDEVAIPHGKKI